MVVHGTSASTEDKRRTGQLYIQCVLTEHELGDFDDWLVQAAAGGDVAMQKAFSDVLRAVIDKVDAKERWKIPLDRCQSEPEKQQGRTIRVTHPKEMTTALRHAVHDARVAGKCEDARPHQELDWLTQSAEYVELDKLLSQCVAEEKYASGTEANQRREITLHDDQQIALFQSIFSCAVAQKQGADGRGEDQQRKPIDSLTLGLITTLYFSLGQRGMNIQDLKWGYLDISKFNKHQVWDGIKPFFLTATSKCKGDKVDGAKHLASVMHHRDPMRCSIAALGLYFAFQFFTNQEALPESSDCLNTMHRRPLVRNQSGKAVNVADFNAKLKQDLAIIGADPNFTFHCIRNLLAAEMGENSVNQEDKTVTSIGHVNTGSHYKSYRAFNAQAVLDFAGYQPDKAHTEVQAAHVQLLHEYLKNPKSVGNKLVDMLYEHHRPELLQLEAQAVKDSKDDGRMRRWCNVVRHCIMTWIVSSVAHPRNTNGLIDPQKEEKRGILARCFVSHLDVLLDTPEFEQLRTDVRMREEAELSMGPQANYGASERRVSAQIAGVPSRVVQELQPQLEQQEARIDDETERGLDRDFFNSLDHEEALFRYQSPDGTVDFEAVRKSRLKTERFRKSMEGSLLRCGAVSVVNAVPPPPPPPPGPPNAGLASGLGLVATPRDSTMARASIAAPPLPVLVVDNDLKVKPAPLPLQPARNSPPAAMVPVTSGKSVAVRTEDTSANTAMLLAKDDEKTREIDKLRAQVARYKPDEDPPPLTQIADVCQMLRVYVSTVAPKERDGPSWRSAQQRGEKVAQRLTDLLTKKYQPVLFAVMKLHMDDGMKIGEACGAVENQRNGRDFTAFCKTLEKVKPEDQKRYKHRLTSEEFETLVLTPPPPSEQPTRPPTPVATPMDAENESESTLMNAGSVASVDGATTRYLALDPALSCGYAVVQLNSASEIVAIDVGVLDVSDKTLTNDGQRCNALQCRLKPLLSPRPDHVFIEPFFGHARASDAISFKLRGAIEMSLVQTDPEITYSEMPPQTWKKAVTGSGSADKPRIKDAIERKMSRMFPKKLHVNGKWRPFKDDASDATGIGLAGVVQRHETLSFAPSFRIAAPGPRPLVGEQRVVEQPRELAHTGATLSAQTDSNSPRSSSPVAPSPQRPDAWACTLVEGCTRGCNHPGLCNAESAGPRTPQRVDFRLLAGKRSSPASDPARKAQKTCPQLGAP